jgi:phosphoglycerate dehydrogenase-like enzyme
MNSTATTALDVTILSDEAHDIASAITQQLASFNSEPHRGDSTFSSNIRIQQVATSPKDIDPHKVSILLSDPDLAAEIIEQCDGLTWCQSTWAGNAPLLRANKRDYLLTGLKGIFGKLMREYVFAYLLQHARNIPAFDVNQNAQPPRWKAEPRLPLHGQTLGILGIGSIGQSLIPVAHAFGMQVIGLSRSGAPVEGTEAVYTTASIIEFAQHADHIVNLMPDTPETQNVISHELLHALKPHSILVNAGRGSAIDEDALITCLDKGTLAHAVLDVFRQEPLPQNHPFWAHPKVSITAHTAAESQPSDVASVFLKNAKRYFNNQPLHYQFDFDKGY